MPKQDFLIFRPWLSSIPNILLLLIFESPTVCYDGFSRRLCLIELKSFRGRRLKLSRSREVLTKDCQQQKITSKRRNCEKRFNRDLNKSQNLIMFRYRGRMFFGHPGLYFFIFPLSIQLTVIKCSLQNLLMMAGFEPRSSGSEVTGLPPVPHPSPKELTLKVP